MPTTAEITQRYVQAHDDIANAITNKGGTVNTGDGFEDFAADIGSIPTAPTANIQPVTILSNGVYTVSGDVDGYSPVTVTVPNTYTLSDEGKVVDNGALVSQTATTITTNNTTVDTTLYNSVTVNITVPQPTLITKNISANGTYNASSDSADGYSSVTVNVPNTYTALDEGCVVDNGTLVPQSSTSISTNGTHNTTLNNSVIVNVPNSYSASDEGKVVDNGALVSQTSTTITTNGVINTTTNNSVTVNVPPKILRLPIGKARPCTNVGTNYTKYWENYAPGISGFEGNNVWSDGTNIYYSDDTNHYVLNKSTGDWSTKTWTGLTKFTPLYIWSDGTNIYYSNGTNHYVLNTATSTWTTKTWTGLTKFTPLYIWSDGTNIYYSNGTNHYVLNTATSTWTTKTWTGLTDFEGNEVWSDGVNIYYSIGTIDVANNDQCVLNTTTSTWTTIDWNKANSGPLLLNGDNIWTDGTNIYYNGGDSGLYMLIGHKGSDMPIPGYWSDDFVMLDDQGTEVYLEDASYIWTDGDNVYYDDGDNHYKLINNYNPNINAPR